MTETCDAREPEPRTGTGPCVLPTGHGGGKHQDKWTNQWPVSKGVTADHQPEPWFWEAGSDQCPHGPEPDRKSDAWKAWSGRHDGSSQDTVICLDAPMGDHCKACFEESGGDVTPWADCPRNPAAQPDCPRLKGA